jgi:hypothetical protein
VTPTRADAILAQAAEFDREEGRVCGAPCVCGNTCCLSGVPVHVWHCCGKAGCKCHDAPPWRILSTPAPAPGERG